METNKETKEFENGRAGAMIFSGLVYTGVVIASTTLFISFVLTAFPVDAYVSRFLMVAAGLLIGASMLAFPIALHSWAIAGAHRKVTIGLYYGEMFIIGLNTIVSFAALLYEYAGQPLPAWVAWYEPFAIGSMVYTLIAWGTIFLTDPAGKTKAKELEAAQEFNRRVAEKELEYLDSIEGEDAIMQAAWLKIQNRFTTGEPVKGQHFGSARKPTGTTQPVLNITPLPHSDNGSREPDPTSRPRV